MKYESRIVLFLDILGFKKIVFDTLEKKQETNEVADNESRIINLYQTLVEMGNIAGLNQGVEKINVTQFSDSIVISFLDESPANAPKVFEIILKIIVHLITEGIICRGALSYGKFIHDKNILFGPALIDAYETESKAAMYPRVIMDKKIYDYSRMYQDSKTNLLIIPTGISDYLKIDLDGKYYIDYVSAASRVLNDENKLIEYYKALREIIINGRKYEQPDLKVKYGWLKMKYNAFLSQLNENLPETTYLYLSKLKKLK